MSEKRFEDLPLARKLMLMKSVFADVQAGHITMDADRADAFMTSFDLVIDDARRLQRQTARKMPNDRRGQVVPMIDPKEIASGKVVILPVVSRHETASRGSDGAA